LDTSLWPTGVFRPRIVSLATIEPRRRVRVISNWRNFAKSVFERKPAPDAIRGDRRLA
jgi:hypothetical protein